MYENIRLIHSNMTRVSGYFYSFDYETATMIQKTDDGTLAFAYPLDIPIPRSVNSLEYDGESYWTMEDYSGTPAAGFIMRRWVIENFVMVLQDSFNFITNATDTFQSEAFAIERYAGEVGTAVAAGASSFYANISSTLLDEISPGTKIFLGPSTQTGSEGESERVTVASVGPGSLINLSDTFTNGFAVTDPFVFSKNIWFFNQHYLKTQAIGALYKANILDGSVLSRTSGGAYLGIGAAGFVDLTGTFVGDLAVHNKPSFLIFVRTNSLFFIDVLDSNLTTELSAIQNNLSDTTTEVYEVGDMGLENDTIFRLQQKININGEPQTTATWNYQLATFTPFPTAIALTAVPAIIPADNTSESQVTATVTDQYALPYIRIPAASIEFSASGGTLDPVGVLALDSNAQRIVTYRADTEAGLVTISAEVTI